MDHFDIQLHRPGGSLGAMMLAIDVSPDQVAELWHGVPLTRAIERCLACPAAARCAAWLQEASRRQDGYQNFCPNAGILDAARRR
jgi:hypothetical protein